MEKVTEETLDELIVWASCSNEAVHKALVELKELREVIKMKLTDQHVSDKRLKIWVDWASGFQGKYDEIMKILLEVIQRRAEDRQREDDGK